MKLGIVGAGVMGRGIAANWCTHDFDTVLVDVSSAQLERATASPKLTTSTHLDAVADCDLVLEAVFEDLETKRELLARIPGDGIVATNTSSLTVSAMASAVRDQSRFLALHYNNTHQRRTPS